MLIQVTSKHNFYDAQLSRNVLQLVNYCMEEQQGHGYRCHPQLEVAFLSFFLIFRRTFVNDQKSFAIIREYEDCKNGPIPQRAEVASIFGVLTTVVNIAVYYIMANSLQIHYLISNIVAWFLSVLFAYVTNRKYVFESKSEQIIKEMTSFFGARLATGAMDMVLMWLFVGLHILPDFVAKVITNVIVIVANYILSKLVVFKGE